MLAKETDLNALQAEAESLAEFLRAEVRTFGKGHRPVELEPDAPVAAALLWKAVGWSPVFEDWVMVEPERQKGEARIQERLEEYRSWGSGFTVTGSDLPARRRLVEDDGQGVGFAITDESAGGIDAPTLAVIADTNEVVPESESYTRWCAQSMAECAFNCMYQTVVEVRPVDAIAKRGAQPWPLLVPGARQLGPDLYCQPPQPGFTEPHEEGSYQLAHRSIEALVAFLQTLECDAIALGALLPGDKVTVKGTIAALTRDNDELRALPALEPETHHGVGQLGGVPVILEQRAGKTNLYTNPRRLADLKAVLKAR